MTTSNRWLALTVISCGSLVCFPFGARAQNMQDDLIMHYCTNAVNAEVHSQANPVQLGLPRLHVAAWSIK